jgi:hypothetical protein
MRHSKIQVFPHRLNNILDDPYNSKTVAWDSDGQSFSILDVSQF